MTYTHDGNIEVTTEIMEYQDDQKILSEHDLEKFSTEPTAKVPCVPEETCHDMELMPGGEICDPDKICHDMDAQGRIKLKPLGPVSSSKLSGIYVFFCNLANVVYFFI